jgi:AcrR family transcriptional regulator
VHTVRRRQAERASRRRGLAGTVYHYFPTRAYLIVAVFRPVTAALLDHRPHGRRLTARLDPVVDQQHPVTRASLRRAIFSPGRLLSPLRTAPKPTPSSTATAAPSKKPRDSMPQTCGRHHDRESVDGLAVQTTEFSGDRP